MYNPITTNAKSFGADFIALTTEFKDEKGEMDPALSFEKDGII